MYRWTENSKGHPKAEGRTNLDGGVVCGIRRVWSRCACSPADGREAGRPATRMKTGGPCLGDRSLMKAELWGLALLLGSQYTTAPGSRATENTQ